MSGNSSDEEVAVTGNETFEAVGYHVQKVQHMLKREALRIQQEKEAFDSVARKLKHVHFASTIKLNVGGQLFTTSLQTLTKDAGSMLHAMFSGRFDTKPAEDGSYFIDRDGTCFRYILNYLRTGKLLLPDDKLVKREVLEEAKFYQIQGIVGKLDPEPYNDSVILSPDQRRWLAAVHGDNRVFSECDLLYRATRDGWSARAFHRKCDHFLGATMVIIKSTESHIFGGYTEQNWCADRYGDDAIYKLDCEAFLFSLVSPIADVAPVQLKFCGTDKAVFCCSKYGPTFGDESHNFDLHICEYPNTQACSVELGNVFQCPENLSSGFFTGSECFHVSEMEVFGLS